jgi:hypothetical protein
MPSKSSSARRDCSHWFLGFINGVRRPASGEPGRMRGLIKSENGDGAIHFSFARKYIAPTLAVVRSVISCGLLPG